MQRLADTLLDAADPEITNQTDPGLLLRAPTDALAAGGDEAKRAFEATMPMRKIDVVAIEAARRVDVGGERRMGFVCRLGVPRRD